MSAKTEVPSSKFEPENTKSRLFLSPQLIAWLVLIVSFGLFCLVAFAVISAVSDYFSHSVQPQGGVLSLSGGTDVSVRHTGQERFILVTQNQNEPVFEGDLIRTAQGSQAVAQLFDNTILELSPNSEVQIDEQKIKITNFVQREKRTVFRVVRGVVKVKVQPLKLNEYSKGLVKATTPDEAEIFFNDFSKGNYPGGVYTVDLQGNGTNRTWVTSAPSNSKPVDVKSAGQTQSLLPGQRFILERGIGPVLAENGERQLVNNGAFIDGFDFWKEQHDQGQDGGSVFGRALPDSELVDDGTITRVHIIRYESKGDFEETSLRQDFNQDVREYSSLVFKFKGRIRLQSLPGGGQVGNEYPLFVKIQYTDRSGQVREFFRGFYFKAEDANTRTYDRIGNELLGSRQWNENKWVEFEFDLSRLSQKPAIVNSLVIGSAGHDFESYFTEVSLLAR